jgi:hypothetical protein
MRSKMTRFYDDVQDGKPVDVWITRHVKATRKNQDDGA